MKILFLLRDAFDCGGIQQTTANLCNCFAMENDKNEVTTLSFFHKTQNPFFNFVPSIKHCVLFDYRVEAKANFLKIRKKLSGFFKTASFDLVIVQGIEYCALLSTKILKSQNVIACEHGHYNMGHFGGIHYFGVQKAFKHAKAIVTLTELDKNEYCSHKKTKTILKTIPNAYKDDYKESTYKEESTTLVSCGSLYAVKQFDKSIIAAANVIKNNSNVTYEIYGDGPEKEKLVSLINSLNMQNNIFLKGYEKEKEKIYSNKSIFILSSNFEGFGMVLLEAMQYGLPIVSFDIPYGPKEIVKEGINGCLVEKDNIDELASTISNLLLNNKLRKNMSANSKKELLNYSSSIILKKWNSLFTEILG